MTKRDWLSVGLKIAGVCIAVVLFSELVQVVMTFVDHLPYLLDPQMMLVLGSLLLFALMALAVVRFGDPLAAKLLPVEPDSPGDGSAACQTQVFTISLRIIAAAFLSFEVSRIVMNVSAWAIWSPLMRRGSGEVWAEMIVSGTVLLVVVVLGLYLLFGGKLLKRLAFRGAPGDSTPTKPDEVIAEIGPQPVILSLALRIIGVVLLVQRLPALVGQALALFPLIAESRGQPLRWEQLLGNVLILAVAVYLISGARAFVRLVLRTTAPPESDVEGAP